MDRTKLMVFVSLLICLSMPRVRNEATCDELNQERCAVNLAGEQTGDLNFLQAQAKKIANDREMDRKYRIDTDGRTATTAKISSPRYTQVEARGSPIHQGVWYNPNQTYKFSNLCFDMTPGNQNRSFVFFSDGSDDSLSIERNLSTEGLNECIASFLDCPDPDNTEYCITSRQCKRTIQLAKSEIPVNAKFLKYTALLVQPSNLGNFGHLVADNLLSLVYMQRLFEVADLTNTLWIFRDPCEHKDVVGMFDTQEAQQLCSRFSRDVFPVFTQHPVISLTANELLWASTNFSVPRDQLAGSHDSLMCLESLIVGPGANDYLWNMYPHITGGKMLPIQTYWYWQLREFGVKSALQAMSFSPPRPMRILIMQKTNANNEGTGAGIGNADELAQDLAPRFRSYTVETQDLSKLTFREQLEKIVTTKVLFGHCGGGSFIAMFLPPSATFVVLNRVQAEGNWFRALGWIHYHPLLAEPEPIKMLESRFVPFNVSHHDAANIVLKAILQKATLQ